MSRKKALKKAIPENFQASAWLRRRFLLLLGGIVLAAFATRIALCWALFENDPSVSNPSVYTDMHTYKELARQFASGEFKGEFDYQPFYYTAFLPLLRLIFGGSVWPVMIAQSLLGAVTVLLAGLAAGRIWGRMGGLLAALLCAFSAVLLLYTPYHLLATLQAFWVMLLFYLCLEAMRKKLVLLRWTLVGLVAGLAILTRGNIWLLVPGILIAALWAGFRAQNRVEDDKRSALVCFASSLIPALVVLLCVIAPQVPYAWHNSLVKGKLCGPSSAGGKVLALGNSPEAPPGGREPGSGPGPMEYPPTYHAWMEADAKGEPVTGKILAWAKEEPLAFLELQLRKLLLFWDAREIPNNIAVEFNGAKTRLFGILGFVPSSFLLVNALAALLALGPLFMKRRGALLLAYFVLAYWVATAAFYILCRFRAPILPLLAVLSAGFVIELLRESHARHFRTVFMRFLPSLIFGFFVVAAGYEAYRCGYEAPVMRLVRPAGTKVMLAPGKLMLLDNGPMNFGGWAPFEAKEGMFIEKKFAFPAGKIDLEKAVLSLTTVWESPGSAVFEINGEKHTVRSGSTPLMQQDFPIAPPQDGTISIRLLSLQGQMSLIADTQRDYGRTLLNDKRLGAELVSRLNLYRKND